jgi:predicted ferric reductase
MLAIAATDSEIGCLDMKRWILLTVMGLCTTVPIVFWAQTLSPGLPFAEYLYDTGRVLALVGFVFALFQFVFSSRIKWIERDIGLDKLFNIHRTAGLIALTFLLIHPVFLFLSDIAYGDMPSFNLPKAIGFTSLFIFILVVGAAVLYSRLNLKYETWKTIHWASYVALPLGFVHSLRLGSDLVSLPLRVFWFVMAGSYVVILASKLWNHLQVRRHPYRVTQVVQETHDTWSLYFEGRRIDYQPGQFLMVWLIRNGRVSEPHPFTITSSPTEDRLSISVKSVGDFTNTIGDTKPTDRAYIDAPYGVFSFLNQDARNLVFIAGGIGITPFMSMLRYMVGKGLDRNVLLIWGNKAERDIAFRDELDSMVAGMPSLRVVHVMSSQDDWPGEKGYVDAKLLNQHIQDVDNPQVFVCGPPVMMRQVIGALRELGVPTQRIHYERFVLR